MIHTVEAIMHDHAEIRARLTRFKELVASAEQGSTIARSTIVEAANTFVETEWAHMERERSELFPLAADAFQAADWSVVEGHLASIEDTLFGRVLAAPFQRLHQLLLEASTKEEITGLLSEAVA
jgi:hemerythrin-like domain-containing protein